MKQDPDAVEPTLWTAVRDFFARMFKRGDKREQVGGPRMAVSIRTPAQAIAKANTMHTGYGGMCLQFVRLAFNAPSKYSSAIKAWNASGTKHRTTSTSGIPVGAPIWFSGSKYGHVAIYLGNGMMRTTHGSTNRIGNDRVTAWRSYGFNLLGWTEDINGYRIPGLGAAPKPPAPKPTAKTRKPNLLPTTKRGHKNVFVGFIQSRLDIKVDNSFGPGTEKAVKNWQRSRGLTPDGEVGPRTWVAMMSDPSGELKRGDRGGSVKILQYLSGVQYDGVFGAGTATAVSEVQRYLKVGADGVWGSGSRNALLNYWT